MLRRISVLLAVVLAFACEEQKAAPPPPPAAAPKPPPPPPPPVALPAAPAIPATPKGLPAMEDSKDNPTTPEKVALGEALFFDKRLSKDGSMACAECHHPDLAWTDGKPLSAKVGGAMNKRNTPTVENLGYNKLFYWDGRKPTLETVSEAAWTGQLGADANAVSATLNGNPTYKAMFQRAFQQDASPENVPKAFAAFLRALKTGDSAWDKFEGGDKKAASKEAQHGFEVFKTASCALCHVPPLYTDFDFHNVGVGSDLPDDKRDHGRMDATKDAKDDGKFKTPTLRDVAKTGPYFHDGSGKSLDEAIDFMLGGGKKNKNLDAKLKPHKLSKKDREALKAFIESISGTPTFATAPTLPQ
jgi:cytochrome c peroxidase